MVMKRYERSPRNSFMKNADSHPPWLTLCPIEHAEGKISISRRR